jgi:ubiquitin-protein ligase
MSINPRLNRLQAEYEKIRELSDRSEFVHILETEGNPPEKYLIQLTCKGISSINGSSPIYSENHHLGIYLPPEFPRKGPVFQMMTPVWHPNIAQNGAVCYGDDGDHGYSPSMGLDDLVIRIINMIRYENMGLNSAFNVLAAQWASHNQRLFPLDTSQIVQEKVDIDIFEINIVTSENSKPDDNLLNDIIIN